MYPLSLTGVVLPVLFERLGGLEGEEAGGVVGLRSLLISCSPWE